MDEKIKFELSKIQAIEIMNILELWDFELYCNTVVSKYFMDFIDQARNELFKASNIKQIPEIKIIIELTPVQALEIATPLDIWICKNPKDKTINGYFMNFIKQIAYNLSKKQLEYASAERAVNELLGRYPE